MSRFAVRTLLFFAPTLASFPGSCAAPPATTKATIVQSKFNGGGGPTGMPLILTLDRPPSVGDMLFAVIGYNIYPDYDYAPPDRTWSCNVGGRSAPSAGGSMRIATCSHIVTPNEKPAYTFKPNTTDGPGGGFGLLLEAANVVGAQVAYSHAGTHISDLQTPSLIPAAAGSLPIAATVGGSPATPAPGWRLFANTVNVAFSNALTKDAVTPVSTVLKVENNYANSLQALILLTPGRFSAAATASLAPGAYTGPQTLSLAPPEAGSLVHFTLDGTSAGCDSPAYSAPISMVQSTTVSTIVCAAGTAPSAVSFNTYVIGGGTLAGVSLGANASLNGYTIFPGDLWHTPVADKPVDRNSATTMALLLRDRRSIRHDWSSLRGGYGIPYIVVDSSLTPPVVWTSSPDRNYLPQSDVAPYPIPDNMPIESNPAPCTTSGDNHAIILDRHLGVLYEMWRAQFCTNRVPKWSANNAAIFDLMRPSSVQRPYTYTSADAGGLSIFEGLVRYDEIEAGVINHAIRFTSKVSGCFYNNGNGYGYFQPPATHAACTSGQQPDANNLIYYGMRLRLRADFDISRFSRTNQIILTAMKKYGLIMADLGNTFDFQGAPDARWDDADLEALDSISAANFEVVQHSTIEFGALNKYPGGKAPKIHSFNANPSTIAPGACATLTAEVTDASFSYIDKVGFLRDSKATVCPTVTTTYQLTATGLVLAGDDGFGDGTRPTKSVTVKVTGSAKP